jgi:hypothetical protein
MASNCALYGHPASGKGVARCRTVTQGPADSQNPNIAASNWNITTGPPHFLLETVFAGASRCIHKPAPLGGAIIKTLVNTSESLLKGQRIGAADLSLSDPCLLLTEICTGRAYHYHKIRLVPTPIGQLCITFTLF